MYHSLQMAIPIILGGVLGVFYALCSVAISLRKCTMCIRSQVVVLQREVLMSNEGSKSKTHAWLWFNCSRV